MASGGILMLAQQYRIASMLLLSRSYFLSPLPSQPQLKIPITRSIHRSRYGFLPSPAANFQ